MANTAISIALAGVHQVDGIWAQVADGLEHACRKTGGDLTADYLWSECRSGAAFLVVISREQELLGASIWRFEKWSSGKKLRCLALYGKHLCDWLQQHIEFTKAMASAGGATSLVTEGRRGFQRVFPKAKVLRQLYEVAL